MHVLLKQKSQDLQHHADSSGESQHLLSESEEDTFWEDDNGDADLGSPILEGKSSRECSHWRERFATGWDNQHSSLVKALRTRESLYECSKNAVGNIFARHRTALFVSLDQTTERTLTTCPVSIGQQT